MTSCMTTGQRAAVGSKCAISFNRKTSCTTINPSDQNLSGRMVFSNGSSPLQKTIIIITILFTCSIQKGHDNVAPFVYFNTRQNRLGISNGIWCPVTIIGPRSPIRRRLAVVGHIGNSNNSRGIKGGCGTSSIIHFIDLC